MDNLIHVFEQVQNPTQVFEVVSSNKTDMYKVMTDGGNWSCTCLSYFYRGDCKHIRDLKENTSER